MLGEDLGYSSELFKDFAFSSELSQHAMALCAEPTCEKRCVNCKSGCNSGPDPDPNPS